jgi:epoxyqueuosine reductase
MGVVCSMDINEELRQRLREKGAGTVGFADLTGIPAQDRYGYGYGISIAVPLSAEVVSGIRNGPTMEYYDQYKAANMLLNELDEYAAGILREHGYEALPMTQSYVSIDETTRRTRLPHKTVATRAGLGWIGKCALLVTEGYGSAVRISSVLTNAELDAGKPVTESRCGSCTVCRDACPAGAVSGIPWEAGRDRDEFYNAFACRRTARERSAKIGVGESLCGLCIRLCPWTVRYLRKSIGTRTGGLELLPLVKPLWEGLREHHAQISEYFSDSILNKSFENRSDDFTAKSGDHVFKIELAFLDGSESPSGYCVSSLGTDGTGEVESLYVKDVCRGLKIGDLLMRNALDWMDANGAVKKRIGVMAGNDVLGFYEKYGFKTRMHVLEQT